VVVKVSYVTAIFNFCFSVPFVSIFTASILTPSIFKSLKGFSNSISIVLSSMNLYLAFRLRKAIDMDDVPSLLNSTTRPLSLPSSVHSHLPTIKSFDLEPHDKTSKQKGTTRINRNAFMIASPGGECAPTRFLPWYPGFSRHKKPGFQGRN